MKIRCTGTSMIENDKLSLPTEEQLDALEWARDFMERYEKRKK